MKRYAVIVLTALGLLVVLTASPVKAQSDLHLNVKIPFEFSVSKKILPAGNYTVRYSTQGVLMIQSVDRRVSQVFNTNPSQAGKTPDESSLVFHQYGDRYFLSAIWTAGLSVGHELRAPHAELALIRASSVPATGALERKTVSIAAHR